MAKLYERQKVMSEKVNTSLNEKVAETIMLEQRLSSAQFRVSNDQKLITFLTLTRQRLAVTKGTLDFDLVVFYRT